MSEDTKTLHERIVRLEQELAETRAQQSGFWAWWQEREIDVRYIVYHRFPVQRRVLMHQEGDFMVGRTEYLQLVKISAADYRDMLQKEVKREKEIRLAAAETRKELRRRPLLEQAEASLGIPPEKELISIDIDGETQQYVTAQLMQPEWWTNKPHNLDGTYVKLP